jgi:hypothetical protein
MRPDYHEIMYNHHSYLLCAKPGARAGPYSLSPSQHHTRHTACAVSGCVVRGGPPHPGSGGVAAARRTCDGTGGGGGAVRGVVAVGDADPVPLPRDDAA